MSENVNYVYAYGDTVFKIVFQEKEELLALYNALSGKNYTNPDDLVVNTLQDVIFLGMKNDLSFLIDSHMHLFEHQSTYTPNMPLRGLLYVADLFRQMIDNRHQLYSPARIMLPTPHFTVFYNGRDEMPDYHQERLSDAFLSHDGAVDDAELDFVAHIYNINKGHNEELLSKCRKLWEYSQFVATVREHHANRGSKSKEDAFAEAIDECIRNNILVDILRKEKVRIMDSLLTEFDMDEYKEFLKEEYKKIYSEEGRELGLRLGRAEGREEGRAEAEELNRKRLVSCVKNGELTVPTAAKLAQMTPEEFQTLLK